MIDTIVPEPLGGAHRDPHTAAHNLEQYIAKTLRELKTLKIDNLLERRYEKFRNLGEVMDTSKRRRFLTSRRLIPIFPAQAQSALRSVRSSIDEPFCS